MSDVDQLEAMLTRLRLPLLRDQLETLLDEAARQELNLREALAFWCAAEVAAKDQRRIAMGTSIAKFPFIRTLEGFDYDAQPSVDAKQIREQFRMNPMKANRYLRELEMWGYIKKVGGYRNTGYEYEIVAWDEYQRLQSGIDVLDQTLQKIKDLEARKNGKAAQQSGVTLV